MRLFGLTVGIFNLIVGISNVLSGSLVLGLVNLAFAMALGWVWRKPT